MKKLFLAILIIVIASLCVLAIVNRRTPSNSSTDPTQNQSLTEDKWVALAKALTAQGAKLYGASWCSHCQEQKAMFGDAWKYISYVECADEKYPNRQTDACAAARIESYPTWIFGDGIRKEGAVPYEELAHKVGL